MNFQVPALLTLLALLTGCAGEANRAGCPPSEQTGVQGAEWRLCPVEALTRQGSRKRLAGLALEKTLSVGELQRAIHKAPVRLRVAFFAAGNWRGTWAEPSPVAGGVGLQHLTEIAKNTAQDAQTSARKNAVQVIRAKSLERVLGESVPESSALEQLETSASLRFGVLRVAQEHAAWADARAVARGERGFIGGLQAFGTPAELLVFAEAVGATGFTFDQGELFNSLRPSDPPDLQARSQRWRGTLSAQQLLHLGRAAWADFQP